MFGMGTGVSPQRIATGKSGSMNNCKGAKLRIAKKSLLFEAVRVLQLYKLRSSERKSEALELAIVICIIEP